MAVLVRAASFETTTTPAVLYHRFCTTELDVTLATQTLTQQVYGDCYRNTAT